MMRYRNTRIPFTRGWGLVLAFVSACISGIAIFVNARYVGEVGDATVYTTAKNAVAVVLLVVLAIGGAAMRGGSRPAPIGNARRTGLILLGAIGGSIPFVLFFEGLARSGSPLQAGFIHKTLIVWVALLAVPLLGERFTWLHGGAVALLLLGQASLVDGLGSLRLDLGEVMVLAATSLWAVEFVLAKRLLRSIDSRTVAAARLGIGVIFLGAYVVATGKTDEMTGLTAEQWGWAAVTGVILAGFVTTWFAALARAQAIDVAAMLVFGQIVTSVLTAATTDASIRPDLLGLGLIFAGVVTAARAAVQRHATAPALS